MQSPDVCQLCGGETSIVKTRPADGYVRRRRQCRDCGARHTTIEVCGESAAAARMAMDAGRIEHYVRALSPVHIRHMREALDGYCDILEAGSKALRG